MRTLLPINLAVCLVTAIASCSCPPPVETPAPPAENPVGAPADPAEPAVPAADPAATEPLPADPAAAQPTPATPDSSPAEAASPGQGQRCGDDGVCAEGLECVRYYGVAGRAGPELTSCEIRCRGDATCPQGQRCKTLADGPGQVCR